jgi:hypothetical protein
VNPKLGSVAPTMIFLSIAVTSSVFFEITTVLVAEADR